MISDFRMKRKKKGGGGKYFPFLGYIDIRHSVGGYALWAGERRIEHVESGAREFLAEEEFRITRA